MSRPLAGAGDAAVTPLVGRIGDRGRTRPATVAAHLILLVALTLATWAGSSNSGTLVIRLVGLTLGAVLLDVGITGAQALGRREINLLRPDWTAVCGCGAAFAIAALLFPIVM